MGESLPPVLLPAEDAERGSDAAEELSVASVAEEIGRDGGVFGCGLRQRIVEGKEGRDGLVSGVVGWDSGLIPEPHLDFADQSGWDLHRHFGLVQGEGL